MASGIKHDQLLYSAWNMVRPYILEAPAIVLSEYKILENTKRICEILTVPELFFEFMSYTSYSGDGSVDPDTGLSVSAPICRTAAFKKVPPDRRLAEIYDITNIMKCFMNIFSVKDEAIKTEYRKLLLEAFDNYRTVPFYNIATRSLEFECFKDMINHIGNICTSFNFNVVLTKNMLGYFCEMMPSVISKYYNIKRLVVPTDAFLGLLPMYPAIDRASGQVALVTSIPIERCYSGLKTERLYETDVPDLVDNILSQMERFITGSPDDLFSEKGVFNNDIVGKDANVSANNMCSLTKSFKMSGNTVRIYSYNKTLEDFITIINIGGSGSDYIYVTERLLSFNLPPLGLDAIQRLVLYDKNLIREVNDKELAMLDEMIEQFKMIL